MFILICDISINALNNSSIISVIITGTIIFQAVDVTNEAADKVSVYVKEKELDKKASNAANEVGDAMKSAGKVIENKLSKLSNK